MYDLNFIACAVDAYDAGGAGRKDNTGVLWSDNKWRYQNFIIPYTFFALMNNKNSHVEMVVEDVEKFKIKYKNELEELNKIERIKNNYLIRKMKFKRNNNIPNVYRFYEVPTVKSKYTYIGDIDIMIMEDILPEYFLKFWPGKLPYNNMVRKPNKINITGLQMVKTDKYFTKDFIDCQERQYLKNLGCNDNVLNDEFILGQMCKEIHGLPPNSYRFRPDCGIHFSPNRPSCTVCFLKWENIYFKLLKSYEKLFSFDCFRNLTEKMKNGNMKKKKWATFNLEKGEWTVDGETYKW